MKTCILSYHNYEAFIKHRIVSIVKALPTKMLSSFWGGAIAPAVPIAFPFLLETLVMVMAIWWDKFSSTHKALTQ